MLPSLRLAAPAKLNLYLHVLGKRPDGYHLLDALIAFADIHDTLVLTPSDSLSFTADGPFAGELGNAEANLVVRAARALGAAAGRDPAVALHLTKRLPVASGIGGGSADAAACLRGLAELWGIDPDGPTVRDVAAALGADIPACVDGRSGYMGGIGTDMTPAPSLPPAWLVLANPGIALPTPDVFRARTGDFSKAGRFAKPPADVAEFAALLGERRNDLTPPALARVPAIGEVLDAIGESAGCLLSRMSGSGATCFGIYVGADSAAAAAAAIAAAHPGWWVESGRLLKDTRDLKAG